MDIRYLLYYLSYSYDWLLPRPTIEKKTTEIEYKKLEKEVLYQEITDFVTLITQYFDSDDLNSLYNNINNLEIILNKKYRNFDNAYDPVNNRIYIEESDSRIPIYHELFHLSSTIYKDGIVYSGFNQWSDKYSIGIGITEGYTQLLNEKLMDDKNKTFKHGYNDLVYYTKVLELIIGAEKMSHLYLTSDLKGLVDELCMYASKEEIMKFIARTDYVNNFKVYNPNFSSIEEAIKHKLMIISYKEIKRFLIKTYLTKYVYLINEKRKLNDLETIDQLTEELNNNIDEVMYDYNCILYKKNNKQVKLLSRREIDKIVNSSLNIRRKV